ncbi:MAG: hypothetical protein MJ252_27270, partial [archaeon]|nr:hypothetical protein [archaeon]
MSKKIRLPPEIEKVKENLEKPNFLVDYFLLCGIDPAICTEEPDFFNEDKLKDRAFTPKILSKCPPFEKKIIEIDEGILDFAFPNQLKIKFSKKPPPNEIFSIILDNNLSSYEYPQKYITCFLFYECLAKYKHLEMMINEQKEKENNASGASNPTDEQASLLSFKSSISNKTISSLSSFQPSMKNKNSKFYHCNYYYIPKCIVLCSIWPYISLHQKILKSIYQITKDKTEKPIEKIIQNLILEVPVPPRGIFDIDYYLINERLNLKQNGMNQLPILNFSLHYIDEKLTFNEIMEIIKHILYDSKVIFFSKNVNLLTNIILGFLSLIS